jgi:tetratricopeptide (TPR) repeat protein
LLRAPGVPPAPVEPLTPAHATRLFLARAATHGVRPPAHALPFVDDVCRRLDGIPLAIELAAARARILTVEQIAAELGSSSRILAAGARTAPYRHQSLHAAIDWSHELLDSEEQQFFAAMSVFSGGWTMHAAHALWVSLHSEQTWAHVVDVSARLADKSLIVVEHTGTTARYTMLDVIREFASERLTESGMRLRSELNHLEYFTQLAVRSQAGFARPAAGTPLSALDAELDNIDAALERAISHGRADDGLRLAAAVHPFCYRRGHYAVGRRWLDTARAAAEAGRRSPDPALLASALLGSAKLTVVQGEHDAAVALLNRALGLYDELNDAVGAAWCRHHLAVASWLREDWPAAQTYAHAALEGFASTGPVEGTAWSQINLGVVALYTDAPDLAVERLEDALATSQRDGLRDATAWARHLLGIAALRQGLVDDAASLLNTSLDEHLQLGERWRCASVLEALAAVSDERGDPRQAAFLLGVASAIREAIGAPVPPCEQPAYHRTLRATRDSLGDDQFDTALARGRATPLHDLSVE